MVVMSMESEEKLNTRQRGAAIAELAITVALLLFFALAGLEFARSFKYLEAAAILSREAASIAFRDCAAETQVGVATTCYETVRARIEEAGQDLLGSASVVLTALRYDGDQEACDSGPQVLVQVGEGTYSSRFQVVSGTTSGSRISRRLVCDNRVIVVAEVFIAYRAIVPIIPRFFSYNPSEFYDIAVM